MTIVKSAALWPWTSSAVSCRRPVDVDVDVEIYVDGDIDVDVDIDVDDDVDVDVRCFLCLTPVMKNASVFCFSSSPSLPGNYAPHSPDEAR